MTTETTERLAEAASRVLAMHDDQMFICGCNDEGIVRSNLKSLRAALAAHGSQPSLEREAIEALCGLAPYLTSNQDLLDGAAMNEGRAHGFDVASAKARAVLAKAESAEQIARVQCKGRDHWAEQPEVE